MPSILGITSLRHTFYRGQTGIQLMHIHTLTVYDVHIPVVVSGFSGEWQHFNFFTMITSLQPHTPAMLQHLHTVFHHIKGSDMS